MIKVEALTEAQSAETSCKACGGDWRRPGHGHLKAVTRIFVKTPAEPRGALFDLCRICSHRLADQLDAVKR